MAYYDVEMGWYDKPPMLKRIRPDESDGSCTTLKKAKLWWRREFDEWCDIQIDDVSGLKARDLESDLN